MKSGTSGPGDPGVPAASAVCLFLVGRGWPNLGIQSSRQLQSQGNEGPEGTGRGSSIPFGFSQRLSVELLSPEGRAAFALLFKQAKMGLERGPSLADCPLHTALGLQLRRKRLWLCNLGEDDNAEQLLLQPLGEKKRLWDWAGRESVNHSSPEGVSL